MVNQRLVYLVKNYFDNKLTDNEEEELLELMTSDPDPSILEQFDVLYDKYHSPRLFDDSKKQKNWQFIHSKIQRSRKISRTYIGYAAACICLLIGVGLYLWKTSFNLTHDDITAQNQYIYLKKEKGRIYSVSGSGHEINPLSNEKLSEFGIQKDENGNIVISASSSHFADKNVLTIESSSGQIQCIQLSDGSKVWINSNSKISFPQYFGSHKREIQLVGEAYFEVAHMAGAPFLVKTDATTTEVLGTHFNVSSYPNTPKAITLLEGKVKVSDYSGTVLLEPGQQAYFKANKLDKKTIDTTDILAWQEGYFKFDNISIQALIAQIQEWYDVKYVNIKARSDDRFSGTYKRTDRLDELLQYLEQVSNLKFEIKAGGINVLDK